MTDRDKILAHYSAHIRDWLEEKKKAKLGELVAAYQQALPTADKVSELSVLTNLINDINAKVRATEAKEKKN